MKFLYLGIFILLFCATDSYKILIMFPFPIRSINLLGEAFVKHLLKAGHEVTYITAFPIKNPPKVNFTQIDVSSTTEIFANDNTINIEYMMENEAYYTDVSYVQGVATDVAELTFRDKNFRKFLDDTSRTYDVVIGDFVETEIYAGLSAVYNCPMIWAYSMGAHSVVLRLVDQPSNPAYSMDYLTSNVVPFTFYERVEQLYYHTKWSIYKRFITMPKEEAMYKEFFAPYASMRGRTLPDYEDIIYNSSLIFSNDHTSLGDIPPVSQNFKLIGGFHVEDPPQPLPKDLQDIMDNAQHGVIYFSMGSTWKSKDIPQRVKDGLLKLFGGLKQTVIWKYEEDLPGTPRNLHIVKWAPQQSILAHPNILLFISHGGHLSSTEAFHYGVPLIGIPVFFDQHINIKKATKKGYVLSTVLNTNLAVNLKPLIQEMLNNPKYRQTAKELSWIYHHRPASPATELVHWTEHVIKTKGAPHLRSPAIRMPFYQKYYLDLAAILISIVIAGAVIMTKCLRLICTSYCKQPKQIKKKKN